MTNSQRPPDAIRLDMLLVVVLGDIALIAGFCAALKFFGVWP